MAEAVAHVEPDACCVQGLHWAVELPGVTVERVIAVLPELGFYDKTHMDAVRTFHTDGGDRLVLIPRTGRIQLRLSLDTPKPDRPQRALAWVQWLAHRTGCRPPTSVEG